MPMLVINTNVKEETIKSGFLLEASTAFQAIIGKPMQVGFGYIFLEYEEFIAVHLHPDQIMSFGGTTEPCALIDVTSAGKISPEENIEYSQKIAQLMMEKLGISSDRMYITFVDIQRDNCGYKGTTLGAKK